MRAAIALGVLMLLAGRPAGMLWRLAKVPDVVAGGEGPWP
jgi:hypothetical protein